MSKQRAAPDPAALHEDPAPGTVPEPEAASNGAPPAPQRRRTLDSLVALLTSRLPTVGRADATDDEPTSFAPDRNGSAPGHDDAAPADARPGEEQRRTGGKTRKPRQKAQAKRPRKQKRTSKQRSKRPEDKAGSAVRPSSRKADHAGADDSNGGGSPNMLAELESRLAAGEISRRDFENWHPVAAQLAEVRQIVADHDPSNQQRAGSSSAKPRAHRVVERLRLDAPVRPTRPVPEPIRRAALAAVVFAQRLAVFLSRAVSHGARTAATQTATLRRDAARRAGALAAMLRNVTVVAVVSAQGLAVVVGGAVSRAARVSARQTARLRRDAAHRAGTLTAAMQHTAGPGARRLATHAASVGRALERVLRRMAVAAVVLAQGQAFGLRRGASRTGRAAATQTARLGRDAAGRIAAPGAMLQRAAATRLADVRAGRPPRLDERTRALRPARLLPRRRPGGLMLLAPAAALAWLVWRRPAAGEGGLVLVLALLLAARDLPREPFRKAVRAFSRHDDLPEPPLAGRPGIAARLLHPWTRIPPSARARLPTLATLNVAVALLLLKLVAIFPYSWIALTAALFAPTVVLNYVHLNRRTTPWGSEPADDATSPGAPATTPVPQPEPPRRALNAGTADRRSTIWVENDEERSARLRQRWNMYAPRRTDQPEPVASPPAPAALPSSEPEAALPAASARGRFERLPTAAAAVIVVLAAVWIGYVQPGPLLLVAVLVLGFAAPFASGANREQALTMVLAIAVAVAAVDYVGWRLEVTNWHGWWIAAPLLLAEIFGAVHVLGFQLTIWPWAHRPPSGEVDDPTRHPIYVFIPTVDEGVEILRPTLLGSIAARDAYLARHPHGKVTIVVCNDGRVANAPNWLQVEELADELGVECVTRTEPGGAKAGNIENARRHLQAVGDSFLVIFDADQIARPEFLLETISHLEDRKVGWVQTGQYYANLENPVSRWADDQQSLFYNVLCPGKAELNAAFICGTNVVIRAAALDQIGGLPTDSVTEDFAASIQLHPTWRGVYLTDVLATGLGPLDVPSYLRQQGRWALGTLSVFRSHWRDIFLPRRGGLRIGQRAQYLFACTHYLCGLRDLVYILSPIVFIATGTPAVRHATLGQYLLHFLPYGVTGLAAMWYAGRGAAGFRGVIIGFGSFPVLVESLVSVILRRKIGFAVTPKRRAHGRSIRHLAFHLAFLLLAVGALIWAAAYKPGEQQSSLSISMLWVGYSILMLGSFLWLAWQDMRFHAAAGDAGEATGARRSYPSKLLERDRRPNPAWTLGLAAVLAAPVLLGSRLDSLPGFSGGAPAPFVVSVPGSAPRYVGLSLPAQLLKTRPARLEQDLRTRFSIIGRTQDIQDRFDTAWADRLAAHGERPWIILQFGNFGLNGKPPLDASLPAIVNGLDDQALRRWAEEIRAFGRPVFLTILLQVDRNWAVTSAVANGGIPQDVPKAWLHVRSIFRAAGADNVAWVWAPADPVHDQPYAPPASSIDVVLQSFINYPGTRWGNPSATLGELARRYPTKPLFIETSTAGPPAEKAAWLRRLADAVQASGQVYALLYHEGGPGLDPTTAAARRWSLASDPRSLAAMRQVVAEVETPRGAR